MEVNDFLVDWKALKAIPRWLEVCLIQAERGDLMKALDVFLLSIVLLASSAHAEVVQDTTTTSKETKLKDSKVLIQTSINFTTESLACTWAYPAAEQEAQKRHYHQCAAATCTIKKEGPENFAVTGNIICSDESAQASSGADPVQMNAESSESVSAQ